MGNRRRRMKEDSDLEEEHDMKNSSEIAFPEHKKG